MGEVSADASSFLRRLSDDGHHTPSIKSHSLKKIQLHNYYVSLFSASMKKQWPQRAYLGLYSGPGRAKVEETGEIVETTAMSVFRLRDPFTKYIFVDNEARCIKALGKRIATLQTPHDTTLICDDVGAAVPRIIEAMPSFTPTHGLLSFCFIDPFAADIDFQVIKTLGTRFKMDFLILLMLGRDIRTNFRRYHENADDTRIAALIDEPNWREEWDRDRHSRQHLIRFLLRKFDAAMTRIGYHAAHPDEAHPIRVIGKNVFLYFLVFYSKHELGVKFWQASRAGTDPQTSLDL